MTTRQRKHLKGVTRDAQSDTLCHLGPGVPVARDDGKQLVAPPGARQLPPRGQDGVQQLSAVALAPVRGLDEDLGLGPPGPRHVLAVGQAALADHLARGEQKGTKVPVRVWVLFLEALDVLTGFLDVAVWTASCCCYLFLDVDGCQLILWHDNKRASEFHQRNNPQ